MSDASLPACRVRVRPKDVLPCPTREAVARACHFLNVREGWSDRDIAHYTGIRREDVRQIVVDGWRYWLSDRSKA